jgi:hypothetical protein
METVVFPDAKAAVINYLSEVLEWLVVSQVPRTRPARFVRVLLSGGAGQVNPALDEVAFTIEAWSNSEGEAADTIQLARAQLRNAHQMGGVPVYGYTERGAPVDLPDESGQFRYTYSFSLRFRGEAA